MRFWSRSLRRDGDENAGAGQEPNRRRAKVLVPAVVGLLGVLLGVLLTAYFDHRNAEIQTHREQAAAAYSDFVATDVARRFLGSSPETMSSLARVAVFGDTALVAAVARHACKGMGNRRPVEANEDLLEVVPHMRDDLGQDSVELDYLRVLLVRPATRDDTGNTTMTETCDALLSPR